MNSSALVTVVGAVRRAHEDVRVVVGVDVAVELLPISIRVVLERVHGRVRGTQDRQRQQVAADSIAR